MLRAIGRISAGKASGTPRRPTPKHRRGKATSPAQDRSRDTRGDARSSESRVPPHAGARAPRFRNSRHPGKPLLVFRFGKRVFHRVRPRCSIEVKLGEVVAVLRLVQNMAFLGRALRTRSPLVIGQIAKRHVSAHAHRCAHLLHEIQHERPPRLHRAFVDRHRLVGHKAARSTSRTMPVPEHVGQAPPLLKAEVLRGRSEEFPPARRRSGWACQQPR